MVWGRSHELVELAQFDAGGPRYPGGPRENRALLAGAKKKPWTKVVKKAAWRGIVRMRRQKWFAFLVMGTLNVGLLILGSYVMRQFEAGPEAARNQAFTVLQQEMDSFYRNCSETPYSYVWNVSNCSNLAAIHRKYHSQEQVLDVMGDLSNYTRWSTTGSLLYTASVMSTIGYGYLYPVTEGGKIFTIAFATIAIPTTWGWMGFIGNMWIDLCRWLNRQTFVRCGVRSKRGGPKQRYTVFWMMILLWGYVCAMGWVYMMLPDKNDPAHRQPRGYTENVYFAFITFSTIGFGHYYIGDSSVGDTTLVLVTMFSGVAVLSGFIAIMWQTISKIVVKADFIIGHGNDPDNSDSDSDHSDDYLAIFAATTVESPGVNGNGNRNGFSRIYE
eukprot:m.89387 g.89387  ORF g.89387 m.89387 type:complete len:386 (+) comp9802_c0_seq2:355-1512(+)